MAMTAKRWFAAAATALVGVTAAGVISKGVELRDDFVRDGVYDDKRASLVAARIFGADDTQIAIKMAEAGKSDMLKEFLSGLYAKEEPQNRTAKIKEIATQAMIEGAGILYNGDIAVVDVLAANGANLGNDRFGKNAVYYAAVYSEGKFPSAPESAARQLKVLNSLLTSYSVNKTEGKTDPSPIKELLDEDDFCSRLGVYLNHEVAAFLLERVKEESGADSAKVLANAFLEGSLSEERSSYFYPNTEKSAVALEKSINIAMKYGADSSILQEKWHSTVYNQYSRESRRNTIKAFINSGLSVSDDDFEPVKIIAERVSHFGAESLYAMLDRARGELTEKEFKQLADRTVVDVMQGNNFKYEVEGWSVLSTLEEKYGANLQTEDNLALRMAVVNKDRSTVLELIERVAPSDPVLNKAIDSALMSMAAATKDSDRQESGEIVNLIRSRKSEIRSTPAMKLPIQTPGG